MTKIEESLSQICDRLDSIESRLSRFEDIYKRSKQKEDTDKRDSSSELHGNDEVSQHNYQSSLAFTSIFYENSQIYTLPNIESQSDVNERQGKSCITKFSVSVCEHLSMLVRNRFPNHAYYDDEALQVTQWV